jgi:hypothetical protein
MEFKKKKNITDQWYSLNTFMGIPGHYMYNLPDEVIKDGSRRGSEWK